MSSCFIFVDSFCSFCFLIANNVFLLTLFRRYVPTHLHLMVYELVKNSLRAVQERFVASDRVAPPIRIIVADGIEDVTIKVCCFPLCYAFQLFLLQQFELIIVVG